MRNATPQFTDSIRQTSPSAWSERVAAGAAGVLAAPGCIREGSCPAEEEERRLEAQVLQAQKLESLGVLASGIAHDFNNLLMTILGNVDMALLEMSSESPVFQNVKEIETAATRASELCHQLLAYSGKGKFVIQRIDLNEIIKEMVDLLDVSISKKTLLQCDFEEALPPVKADATQIRQIVMNLIANASDALLGATGIVVVRTFSRFRDRAYLDSVGIDKALPEGTYVSLEVRDTGCGMDEETMRRVFDPFFTTKANGRGLGLAASLGIVRGHKGAILVASRPGEGSVFEVLLPATQNGVELDLGTGAERRVARRGSETVLLVDDEDHVRSVGSRMLEKAGYRVITARDGREAVEVFRARADEIGCVVLDLIMPQMDGLEAIHEIRQIRRDAKVVFSSGCGKADLAERFQDASVAHFLQKPYPMASLVEEIRLALSDGA